VFHAEQWGNDVLDKASFPVARAQMMVTRELRLALICYGGVSLAVYMHGITREVWTLVRASRSAADRSPPADAVEAAYCDLLSEIEGRAGVRLRVLNDIVAGASAGGLNGVFLAQAIATGQSLAPLTRLWLEGADVETLLAPDARPVRRFTKLWAEPIAWAIARRGSTIDETVSEEARDEVSAKLSKFVRARWFAPPFGGDTFTNLILDALGAMADGPAGPPLLPDGQPLDLFVTATDLGGRPQRLRLNSPPVVIEREHRLVFGFRGDRAGPIASAQALAFAGRASASFPGAFPPMGVAEMDRVLAARGTEWPDRAADLARLFPGRSADGTVEEALLIDGSVLTNAPFGPALAALGSRPAKRPVDRRFVYLDPAPGHKAFGGGKNGGTPGFFGTVFAALSAIPREQPIRDDLEAIAGRSARVRRLRRIVDALSPQVEAQVDSAIGRTLFLNRPTGDRLTKWSRTVAQRAGASVGVALVTYRELRLSQMCEQLGATLAAAAGDETLASDWTARLWRDLHEGEAAAEAALDALDVGLRTRRLRHLAHSVADLAQQADGADALSPVRRLIYDRLVALDALARMPDARATLADAVGAGVGAQRLIELATAARDLAAFDEETNRRLADALAKLAEGPRRVLLRDWLGFVVLDIATLPLVQGEGLAEFDEIKVDRVSPEDAQSLGGGTAATLKGVEFNHFGAFFSRRYRENDYLWGRLHGAERMVDIVVSTLTPDQRPPAATVRTLKARLFAAILDEESAALLHMGDLIAELRARVASLAQGGADG